MKKEICFLDNVELMLASHNGDGRWLYIWERINGGITCLDVSGWEAEFEDNIVITDYDNIEDLVRNYDLSDWMRDGIIGQRIWECLAKIEVVEDERSV